MAKNIKPWSGVWVKRPGLKKKPGNSRQKLLCAKAAESY
jgi:hypothetical protein